MNNKSSLRTHFLELLKKQSSNDREAKSQIIGEKLLDLDVFKDAKTILFYSALPGEVQTFAMISKAIDLHKSICLPVLTNNQRDMIPTLTKDLAELEKGIYGITQPRLDPSMAMSLKDLDAVIVPGLAFDKSKNRLGRGVGYYDRFLAKLNPDIPTIALAFDFQITDSLPVESHDIPVSLVISN